MLKRRDLPKRQRGQATLEYAIILILVVTMIIGGIELASTAFASSKASEAAKAGANEFAVINQLRINAQNKQNAYLQQLLVRYTVSSVPDDTYSANTSGTGIYDDYIAYLNDIADVNANGLFGDAGDYETLLTADLGFADADADGNYEDDVNQATASINKYKALIVIEQIKLLDLLLDDDASVPLNKSLPLLADHDPATNTNLARPICGAGNTYDNGLPSDGIYLFNPLPIDLASCAGVDATRGNKSKISILVGGYGTIDDPATYVQGLPKLNQAMYGQYTKVCLNAGNAYVSCNKAHAQMLLKPPGKLCLTNTASNTVDSCTTDTPPIGITGYYFWGQVNDSAAGDFAYSNTEAIEFRPTFQIACNGNSALDPNVMDDDCLDTANLKTVQVHTRYRAVFESFLTFGLQELADADLAQYFFDPSNLRGLGANLGVGIAGSELGPKHQNKNVTVKQFKDFRGCYEVDVETNQVSACS